MSRDLIYFVTGGCGFLGKHIVSMLLEEEPRVKEIRIFDINPDYEMKNLSTDTTIVNIIKGDITKYHEDLVGAIEGVDVVIHTAAVIDVCKRIPDSLVYKINLKGTQNIITACLEFGIEYLVYTSSADVIGPNIKGDPFVNGDENTEYYTDHNLAYSESKSLAENYVRLANGKLIDCKPNKTLKTVVLRPVGIYGEGDALLKEFYYRAIRLGKIITSSPPGVRHSRVYVKNVAWMHILAARVLINTPSKIAGNYYFAYDDSMKTTYERFNAMLIDNTNFPLVQIPSRILSIWANLNDTLHKFFGHGPLLNSHTLKMATTTFTVETKKAQKDFGYTPKYSWDESIFRTRDWVKTLA